MSASPSHATSDPGPFEQQLRDRGFTEIQVREMAPGIRNEAHSHPFEVCALMLDGELQLSCDGRTETFRPGEVFTMDAGREHVEQLGTDGARYLSGRRYPA